MKIIDQITGPKSRKTTLNDIPLGQVFRGVIQGRRTTARGTFLKVHGANHITANDYPYASVRSADVVVVQIEGDHKGTSGLWLSCRDVRDYEPLDVELIIKGRL